MYPVLPEWSTAEWAAVTSSVFTAGAAIAAWLAVRASLALQRAARTATVSRAVLRRTPGAFI